MYKSAFIRARITPELKNEAELVLSELGITPTAAVTMLYKYVVRKHEWPLIMKIPNAKTKKAFEKTDQGIGITSFSSKENFFKHLDKLQMEAEQKLAKENK
jgi:DNA-damage-inducible protein J